MSHLRAYFVKLGKRSRGIRDAFFETQQLSGKALMQLASMAPHNDREVLFESFLGRSYAGSPRAIYELMRVDPRFEDFRFTWALSRHSPARDLAALADERTTIVTYGTPSYYRAFARAKYWVSNSIIPTEIQPGSHHVYVQTWHGTPFKRVGLDAIGDPHFVVTDKDHINTRYRSEGAKPDLFLSSSPFTTRALSSAFGLDAATTPIVATGNPRNDTLFRITDDEVARIKRRLDIPADKQVVLYAPTWRDDQHDAELGYVYQPHIDLAELCDRLGDDVVVLFRAHYLVGNSFSYLDGLPERVRDVTHVADINTVLKISDLLVTDYSSSFFDYLLLGRPIVFYMYDLHHYAEDLRGFYLDVADLPTPVVETPAQLADAIVDGLAHPSRNRERMDAFRREYATYEDGHATERVLDAMLEKGRLQAEPHSGRRQQA